MMTKRPQWWQLYLLGGTMMGLLLLAHLVFAETAMHHLVQIGIVLIGYGLVPAWLRSQASAIEREGWARRDEIAHDPDLSITGQQAFYHLVLSRHDASLQKKEKEQ